MSTQNNVRDQKKNKDQRKQEKASCWESAVSRVLKGHQDLKRQGEMGGHSKLRKGHKV